jgi:hypothetical protein
VLAETDQYTVEVAPSTSRLMRQHSRSLQNSQQSVYLYQRSPRSLISSYPLSPGAVPTAVIQVVGGNVVVAVLEALPSGQTSNIVPMPLTPGATPTPIPLTNVDASTWTLTSVSLSPTGDVSTSGCVPAVTPQSSTQGMSRVYNGADIVLLPSVRHPYLPAALGDREHYRRDCAD